MLIDTIYSQAKIAPDVQESQLCDRPKTPQAVEAETPKELNNLPSLPFPFYAQYPSAPGLIPHPIPPSLFTRYPLPVGRNVPGIHPLMPNLSIPPRFSATNINPDEFLPPKTKISEREKKPVALPPDFVPTPFEPIKTLKPVSEKVPKSIKLDKEIPAHATTSNIVHNDVIPPGMSVPTITPVPPLPRVVAKPEKLDKLAKTIKVNTQLLIPAIFRQNLTPRISNILNN